MSSASFLRGLLETIARSKTPAPPSDYAEIQRCKAAMRERDVTVYAVSGMWFWADEDEPHGPFASGEDALAASRGECLHANRFSYRDRAAPLGREGDEHCADCGRKVDAA